jgi:hypothetical protein
MAIARERNKHGLTLYRTLPIVAPTSGEPGKAFFPGEREAGGVAVDSFRRCPRNGDRVKPQPPSWFFHDGATVKTDGFRVVGIRGKALRTGMVPIPLVSPETGLMYTRMTRRS